MKKAIPLLVTAVLTFCSGPSARAWWDTGHQCITEGALDHLPLPLGAYFRANETYLSTQSGQEPPGNHYIDIDAYPEFDPGDPYSVSRDLGTLIAIHGQSFVDECGTAPWTAGDYVNTLSAQMAVADTPQEWSALLLTAAELSHYVADLHNPLHLTLNYNGQLTGNYGIHARYEGQMVSRYPDELVVAPAPAACTFIPSPVDAIFDSIYVHYPYVQVIMDADTDNRGDPPQYDDAYYAGMWADTGTFTQSLFQEASEMIASVWFTAWVNAGSPDPIYPAGQGDYDLDGDVDLHDFSGMQGCVDGAPSAACSRMDFNADSNWDAVDIACFCMLLGGPG
ncbi:MAG: hypothetical protein JXB13_22605 [Phycisphaerae bacterium]|nr:hypothetical protein [Phycisphaerae bacterium]